MTDRGAATLLAVGLFVLFNANGREIGSYDSQPTKYAARELLLRGTLSLNHIVGRTPELGTRSAFVQTANGRYRSAYSPVPAVMAAIVTWPLWKTGLIDIRAPLAPSLMAALTSSLLVSTAVALLFFAARRVLPLGRAVLLAIAVGAGTGFWNTAAQTLWQHETAIFGLSLAVFAGMTTTDRGTWMRAAVAGLGLGLAVGSRLQLAPAAVLLFAGLTLAGGWPRALVTAIAATAIVVPVLVANHLWFGTLLGAAPMLESLHESVHATSGSFALRADGFAGLLVSPSRGLLVFSPVVLVAFAGLGRVVAGGARAFAAWCAIAAAAQFVLYACYTVWWGGHTFGPRYMLDTLPLLVPAAAHGMTTLRGWTRITLASTALAWSVVVAAIGAFNYPHDRWNSDPVDVDRNHERLWDWSDHQIRRAWDAGASPQNFALFTRDAVRVPEL